jgi:nucleotide-binding universal stress UspA family protein
MRRNGPRVGVRRVPVVFDIGAMVCYKGAVTQPFTEEGRMFKHILIPTDGSELSQKAIRIGVELAKFHGARVTGVHAIPDYHLMIAYEGAFDPVTEERIEKEARMRADSYLEFIKKTCAAAGVPCDSVCETSDHPYDAIVKTADAKNCDLILLHSHGRKGLAAVLLGSETRKVLTYAKIPVMVVR